MKVKKLFNPEGNDSDRKIINGNTTNVFNLYDVKYQWAFNEKSGIFTKMLQNHWIPEKSGLSSDKNSYTKLTPEEQTAFLKILSFLIFLDSIQTNNLGNIQNYITAPEVVLCLSRQQFDEALHSRSYGYILTSIFDRETAMKAIYFWRDDEVLLKRNAFVASKYQNFLDNPTDDNFLKVLVSNFILEGIYFYNGFMFFYNLASRGLMIETSTQIKYINRDELLHCNLFQLILGEVKRENPDLWERNIDSIYEMFKEAREQEIEFSLKCLGDGILGISEKSIKDYTDYMCNKRLKQIGLKKIFNNTQNPYKHLSLLSGIDDENSNKVNIFEGNAISYKQSTFIDGWDELF